MKMFSSNVKNDVSHLTTNHEEADTRILLHVHDACNQEYARLVIECRGSDVLPLLLVFANQLSQEIWMKSGTTKKPCFVKVLEMNLSAEILESLLAFHAATVCDTTSQFTSLQAIPTSLGEHEIPTGAAVSVVEEICVQTL